MPMPWLTARYRDAHALAEVSTGEAFARVRGEGRDVHGANPDLGGPRRATTLSQRPARRKRFAGRPQVQTRNVLPLADTRPGQRPLKRPRDRSTPSTRVERAACYASPPFLGLSRKFTASLFPKAREQQKQCLYRDGSHLASVQSRAIEVSRLGSVLNRA